MKPANILVMMTIVFAVFFLSGCTGDHVETAQAPYYGGYEGIVAELTVFGSVTDSGSDNEVWEDESFPVSVELMNKGEYTMPAHEMEMTIKGISPSDFTGIDFLLDNPEPIEKVSSFMPDGGTIYVNFGNAKYNNLQGTYYDANIFLYYVYPYETYINIQDVCYKENLKDTTICTVDQTRRAYASGGPIQIGSVKERYIGKGKLLLEIPIKNVQDGYAKARETDEFRPEWDEIYFESPDADWECKCRGDPNIARITHPNGIRGSEEVTIICTNNKLEQDANFIRPVTLKLSYYYQDWVNQVVRIRESLE